MNVPSLKDHLNAMFLTISIWSQSQLYKTFSNNDEKIDKKKTTQPNVNSPNTT